MSGWDSTYNYAKKLLDDARCYDNDYAKSSTLKKAWNAAYGLPSWYSGRQELLSDIEWYANSCGIDLDKISAY